MAAILKQCRYTTFPGLVHINQILVLIYLGLDQWTLVHFLAFQPGLAFLLKDKEKERKAQIRTLEKKLGQWLS